MNRTHDPVPVVGVVTDAGSPAPTLLAAQMRKRHRGQVHVVHGPWEQLADSGATWFIAPRQFAAGLPAGVEHRVVPYDPAAGPAAWDGLLPPTP